MLLNIQYFEKDFIVLIISPNITFFNLSPNDSQSAVYFSLYSPIVLRKNGEEIGENRKITLQNRMIWRVIVIYRDLFSPGAS